MRRIKKSGFTLAEVLITLAIIGVVATLTLPALMSNTQEQQSVTGFRKAMNTLNEVAQMNAAVDGFDFGGITSSDTEKTYDGSILEPSVYAMITTKARVNKDADYTGSVEAAATGTTSTDNCKGKFRITFQDGTALCYATTDLTGAAGKTITAYIDTNGPKAPNALSTCTDTGCTKDKFIRDQFVVTLDGAQVIPGKPATVTDGKLQEDTSKETYAARWAMNK